MSTEHSILQITCEETTQGEENQSHQPSSISSCEEERTEADGEFEKGTMRSKCSSKPTNEVQAKHLMNKSEKITTGASILMYADDVVTYSFFEPVMSSTRPGLNVDDNITSVSDRIKSAEAPKLFHESITSLDSTSKEFDHLQVFSHSPSDEGVFIPDVDSSNHSNLPALKSRSSSCVSSFSDSDDSSAENKSKTDMSVSSLLSSYSSESNDSLLSSETESSDQPDKLSICSGSFSLESLKLAKKFETRRRVLRRVSNGNKRYRLYLSRQEEKVQLKARHDLSQRRRMSLLRKSLKLSASSTLEPIKTVTATEILDGINNKDASYVICSASSSEIYRDHDQNFKGITSPPTVSATEKVCSILCFEKYHSIPGLGALFLHCVTHISIYEGLWNLHLQLVSTYDGDAAVIVLPLILGFFLCRISGGLFYWLNDDTYEGARFDLHNKVRLRHIDAKFISWLRKHSSIREAVDLVGLYLCFIAVGHLIEERLLPFVCDVRKEVEAALPSNSYDNIHTSIKRQLSYHPGDDLDFNSTCSSDSMCCMDSGNLEEIAELADERFVESKLSYTSFYTLFGDPSAPAATAQCVITYHCVNAVISMLMLVKIGVGFMRD